MSSPVTVITPSPPTPPRCDEVAAQLCSVGIHAVPLHGDLSQGQREQALREFTDGTAQVLVATDVASRGLDIKGIGHVVNLDLPKTFEDYVHRIGRTGRAGTTGRATSFYTERDGFIVSQIKQALSELEKGNAFAFATGWVGVGRWGGGCWGDGWWGGGWGSGICGCMYCVECVCMCIHVSYVPFATHITHTHTTHKPPQEKLHVLLKKNSHSSSRKKQNWPTVGWCLWGVVLL